MVLEINEKEQEMLKRALDTFEGELRTVIVKTDKRALRQDLRDDEELVKKILEKITWH